MKFTGHERDSATLDYMHARYYTGEWGRFLSVDPAWESADLRRPQSWNRYSYVLNNPVNMVDPDGKWGIIFDLLDGGTPLFEKGYDPEVSDNPPRSQAEFDQRVAAGTAVRTYQTYTKVNPETGEVYTGRTSGPGTPEQNVARRDAGHHKNAEGYDRAQVDRSSTNKDAIRGREQQGIDANGGARSRGGTSGNAIDGISHKNPKKPSYIKKALREFGDFILKVF
jgi:RHS repeat-associated protein